MTDEPKDDLRACPFCGLPLFIRGGVNSYGRCDTAGCWMHERKATVPLDDRKQVAAFNTRPEPAPSADLARAVSLLREARAFVDPHYFPGTAAEFRDRIDAALNPGAKP